jgi:hypothetical protein
VNVAPEKPAVKHFLNYSALSPDITKRRCRVDFNENPHLYCAFSSVAVTCVNIITRMK